MANRMKPVASSQKPERAAARRGVRCVPLVALVCLFAGCERNDMHNQPKHEPHEASTFFDDGMASRPLVPGAVARGELTSSDLRFGGLAPAGEQPADTFPFEITKAELLRGQERYNIYCSVCHGQDGDGNGMIVQRGFTRPPSFHEQRLVDAPAGHFFNVITNGWGAMYSYNDRIDPHDRWRIIAYVRTLQLSQADAVAAAGGIPSLPLQSGAPGGSGTSGAAGQDDDAVRRAVERVIGDATAPDAPAPDAAAPGTPAQPEPQPQPNTPVEPNANQTPQPQQQQPPTGGQPSPEPGGQQ